MFNEERKPAKIKPQPIDLALLEPLNEIILGKRKMTDNIERTDSISVLSLKDRFANSFMQSSPKLIKSQVPKTVQVDEVFEVSTD